MRSSCLLRSRLLLPLLVGLAAVPTVWARDAMPWVPDYATAQRVAKETNKIILIHFCGDNCPPCERIEERVFSDAMFCANLGDRYVPVRVNATTSPDIARYFHVESWPTDILVSHEGRELFRMTSPADTRRYLTIIGQVAWRYEQAMGQGDVAVFAPQNMTNLGRDAPMENGPQSGPMANAIAAARAENANAGYLQPGTFSNGSSSASFSGPRNGVSTAAYPGQGSTDGSAPIYANVPAYSPNAGYNGQGAPGPSNGESPYGGYQQSNQAAYATNATASDPYTTYSTSMPEDRPIVPSMVENRFVSSDAMPASSTIAAASSLATPASHPTNASPLGGNRAAAPQIAMTQPPTSPHRTNVGDDDRLNTNAPPQAIPTTNNEKISSSASNGETSPTASALVTPESVVTEATEPSTAMAASHPAEVPAEEQEGANQLVTAQIPSNAKRASAAIGNTMESASTADGDPGVAMNGYCCVTLMSENQWVTGDRRWGVRHRGRVFLFQTAAAQQQFLADPDKYSPALSGFDPVVYGETGLLRTGSRAHGVRYQDQMYLFTSEDSLQKFWSSPWKYADMARQVMASSESMIP